MKTTYKQKLFIYFLVIFALFTLGIAIFEQSRERKFRTETLEGKLDAYADAIHKLWIRRGGNMQAIDSLLAILPSNIRATLIDHRGDVLYDNILEDVYLMENHAGRPEILSAQKDGKGTCIRVSASNNLKYLYYAKRFHNYFIRVSLPYDIQVRSFLKPDNLFLYYIAALFIIMLFFINYVAGRFSKSIKQLNDFTISSENAAAIDFPDDELGTIGKKIAENYALLEKSRKELALEKERLLQHVYTSGEGICFFSVDRTVEFYNGLFIQYLNTISDESGADPAIILTDPVFGDVAAFVDQKEEYYYETQINKQGKIFAVRANIFEDRSFEIIVNDITKHEKTRLLKQEMTGNIAHELRTPITSIRGYLELILTQNPDDETARNFLMKMHNQTLALSELIQDMSLISKIEEAPQSFQLEAVNIKNLLVEIRNDAAETLKEKNIRIHLNMSDHVIVNGNQNLIYSIFRNLTDNALRYAGKDIDIEVNVYNEDKEFYYFSYSDTGTGIPEEYHLNRLFERFYRINEGRTRDTGGSGLGLSIVKNAILFHKGTIVAKNRISGGLEFLFNLPKI
jgi:signal transduction histidine kinase